MSDPTSEPGQGGDGTDQGQRRTQQPTGGTGLIVSNAIKSAKTTRRQRKAAVTRLLGTIDQLIAEGNVNEVKVKLEQVKKAFTNMEQGHDYYQNMLTEDDDIAKSEEWFLSAQRDYVHGIRSVNAWLEVRDRDTVVSHGVAGSNQDVTKMMEMMSIPKVELDKFNGDPMQYQTFITVFDEIIGSKPVDDQLKLTRLMQYTDGAAKDAIKTCPLIGPGGYKEARDILANRFGNPHIISQSIIDDLKSGKPISKNTDLQQLADNLTMAKAALDKLNMASEIDNQRSMIDILNRCPPYINNKWRVKALEYKRDKGKYPDFKVFVEFVNEMALNACDPVYGKDMLSRTANKSSYQKSFNYSSVAEASYRAQAQTNDGVSKSNGTDSRRPCVVCERQHSLFQCNDFKSMSPKERRKVIMRHRLCFNCFSGSHFTDRCLKASVCSVPGCGLKHSKFIHVDQNKSSQNTANPASAPSNATGNAKGTNNGSVTVFGTNVHLPIVPVVVNESQCVFALCDTGSTNTFISQNLATELSLTGPQIDYQMTTLSRQVQTNSKVVSFDIKSVTGDVIKLKNVLVVPKINARYSGEEIDVEKFPHLAQVPLKLTGNDIKADIIIGMDNAHLFIPIDVQCGDKGVNEPYAVRTVLGWTLNGPTSQSNVTSAHVVSNFVDIESQVSNLWQLENSDDDFTSLGMSVNDKRVIDLWDEKCVYENGHYTLPVPWIDGKPNFPDNRRMALYRLNNLTKKLSKTDTYDEYSENIDKLLNKGYAEKVPTEELNHSDGTVWYLPHHGVKTPSKPKLRVVFDCAARQTGVSLNNQALQGPDLINKLVGVLLRFRQYQYAVTADVEGMYLQVKISQADRNALRFLWYEGGQLCHYRMTSHLFGGVWCAASSTYALRRTVRDFPCSEQVSDTIFRSFYVDDMLRSVPTITEARDIMHETKATLAKGGFNLTKFLSNSTNLLEEISVDDRAAEVKVITPDIQSKALGIKWDVTADEFYYVSNTLPMSGSVTKRKMLSIVSRLYDPLGLIGPIIFKGRFLFQEVTRLKLKWDDVIPDVIQTRWMAWLQSLSGLEQVRFARCLIPHAFIDGVAEIHNFCDASKFGFGTCSYLRVINAKGEIKVSLIAGKCRLAPIKPATIPRLELCGAVEAIKLNNTIRHHFDIDCLQSTFWTDSQIVLDYIRNETRRFKVFVANRVSLIRQSSSPDQWRHVSGCDNPADVVSRGCDLTDLPESWIQGPAFLRKHKSDWPIVSSASRGTHDFDSDPEVCPATISTMCSQVSTQDDDLMQHPLEKLVSHYSSYYRLRKAVAWWVRLKTFLKEKKNHAISGPVTSRELSNAEHMILCYVQRTTYPEEIESIQKGIPVKGSSKLAKLSPEIDDGLLVVGGRIRHAILSHRGKHPIILPSDHRVSRLIVQDYHGNTHLGTEWTLSQLRGKFWIIRARRLIKHVKRQCITCKKLYGKQMTQRMSDLPPERVLAGHAPFAFVGLDLFGPLYVKSGRSEVKRYGSIYTCFNTRAVHIEVLKGLDTDCFINGFMRFVSRRGTPVHVWSDQGTNLVGAKSELARSLRQLDKDKVVRHVRRLEVLWDFNPPLSSNFGGVWERMIRTVRKVLVALLQNCTRATDDVIHTVLCQVESIVNSRPITKCTDDVDDFTALTPNHLLLLKGDMALPWGDFDMADTYRKHWRHAQYIVTQFWNRWTNAYLPELQKRPKWLNAERNVMKGDLVLVTDINRPRGSWPLALVTDVKEGNDGLVRSVQLKTPSGQLTRPVNKLVFLEGSN